MHALYAWFAMGGYSTYVWSAYAIVFGVLMLQGFSLQRHKRRTQKKLHQWFKR